MTVLKVGAGQDHAGDEAARTRAVLRDALRELQEWLARDRPATARLVVLTRRAVLTDAFAYLGQRYGWGDREGGRDCSRYLMDLFAGLGLEIPRHTSDQAIAGSYVVDVAPDLSEPERQRLLDEHLRRGVVLLHFPGHIMLYLGRDQDGVPMAIHSFAEYLVPCSGRSDGAPAGKRASKSPSSLNSSSESSTSGGADRDGASSIAACSPSR